MGFIRIGQLATIELDDELLDHVFAVVIAKLRRHEPVLLRWNDCEDHTEQVFVNPSCALIAEFGIAQRPPLDHDRLERLMLAANSTGGICLTAAADVRAANGIPTARPATLTGPHSARPAAAMV